MGATRLGEASTNAALPGTHIANGAIGQSELAADAVTASHIVNGAVGQTELAADAVTASHIVNGAVGTDELAAGAVTTAKIGDSQVTGTKIADGTITAAKLGSGVLPPADPFFIIDWYPAVSNGTATSWSTASTKEFSVPAPGWLNLTFVSNWGFNGAANSWWIRFVPMNTSNVIDTTITNHSAFQTEHGNDGHSAYWIAVNVTATWYISSARTMRVGMQYQVSASNIYINNTSYAPAVIQYIPEP